MTPPQLEAVTIDVLQQLDAVHPNGMKADSLLAGLHQNDKRYVNEGTLASLLADLESQKLVAIKGNTAVPELKRFIRTVNARAWLTDNGY
jgi:hypothetical protein